MKKILPGFTVTSAALAGMTMVQDPNVRMLLGIVAACLGVATLVHAWRMK